MSEYGSSYQSGGSSGTTLSAFFDSRSEAESALERLRGLGVPESSIRLTEGSQPDESESGRPEQKGFFEALGDFFFPDEDRYAYAEGLSRGGYLLTVSGLSADLQETALDLLDDAGAVDIDERESAWRAEGWSGYQGSGSSGYGGDAEYTTGATGFAEDRTSFSGRESTAGEGATVPVVEEQLRVGKRDTSHGRVRVRSYLRETPVSEQVELTDERVEIERRPVDRPVSAGDDPFRERSIEAEEHGEEAVVSKEARVVEEIGLRRERDTHRETVSDTVRHTEVEVEDDRTEAGRTGGTDRR